MVFHIDSKWVFSRHLFILFFLFLKRSDTYHIFISFFFKGSSCYTVKAKKWIFCLSTQMLSLHLLYFKKIRTKYKIQSLSLSLSTPWFFFLFFSFLGFLAARLAWVSNCRRHTHPVAVGHSRPGQTQP